MKGFKGLGENELENTLSNSNKNDDMYQSRDMIIKENNSCEIWDPSTENHSENGQKIEIKANSELDLQILKMIEKSDGVWKCKVCGKTKFQKVHMRHHAETHIEGMSHPCHICNKSFPNRPGLGSHINDVHSELVSCDLCGKSGMTKRAYRDHKKSKHHRTLSATSS